MSLLAGGVAKCSLSAILSPGLMLHCLLLSLDYEERKKKRGRLLEGEVWQDEGREEERWSDVRECVRERERRNESESERENG